MKRVSWTALPLAIALCGIPVIGQSNAQAAHNPAGSASVAALDQSIASYLQGSLAKHKKLSSVNASVDDRVVTLNGSVDSFRDALEAEHLARNIQSVSGVVDNLQVTGPTVPDPELQKKIAERLTYDRIGMGQTFNYLTAQVQNGIVTLGGEVLNYADRDSAYDIVADTKGVKKVIDHVQVAPTSQFDDQIRFEAARAIYGNPQLQRYATDPAHPIRIIVNNGHVTLAGVVSSQVDKQVAQSALTGINGIFSVNNQLIVAGQKSPQMEK